MLRRTRRAMLQRVVLMAIMFVVVHPMTVVEVV